MKLVQPMHHDFNRGGHLQEIVKETFRCPRRLLAAFIQASAREVWADHRQL